MSGFSEIDADAEITYKHFFGQDEQNYGDLMKINPDELPSFDFMVGGFPCQTFSIIGTRCGLDDETRGQVIYGLVNILKAKNVKYFILENVKGLISHDKGRTLETVLELLDNAGYKVYYETLNSLNFGVPQMRERIYLVGIQKALINNDFKYEFSQEEQQLLLKFFRDNQTLIVNDILKGRGKFLAEWMLVILKLKDRDKISWALEPINKVLNHFGNGEIYITPRGSFKIGNITIQREGGDNGRETANMLQFKINPAELLMID